MFGELLASCFDWYFFFDREISRLRWFEIVSWRATGPLISRARASTSSSRRCKFDDPSKILQNLYFDRKYLWKLTVKIWKIWHSGKERTEISVLIEKKNYVRSKQNERENRIIWNFSESFLQNSHTQTNPGSTQLCSHGQKPKTSVNTNLGRTRVNFSHAGQLVASGHLPGCIHWWSC